MRQKLINLIDKYEKKLALPVDDSTKRYYLGKIDSFKVSLTLLEANGGDN
ncbi:Uncharacterised protein [Streptococcus pneumoniae]|nr:Uncharacterised protein [Streptococcus pneumoniae]